MSSGAAGDSSTRARPAVRKAVPQKKKAENRQQTVRVEPEWKTLLCEDTLGQTTGIRWPDADTGQASHPSHAPCRSSSRTRSRPQSQGLTCTSQTSERPPPTPHSAWKSLLLDDESQCTEKKRPPATPYTSACQRMSKSVRFEDEEQGKGSPRQPAQRRATSLLSQQHRVPGERSARYACPPSASFALLSRPGASAGRTRSGIDRGRASSTTRSRLGAQQGRARCETPGR